MTVVMRMAGGLRSGYQLEKYFEPDKFPNKNNTGTRKCNYDRYLKGVKPGKVAMSAIATKHPNALSYYESPIWAALKAGEQSEQYWTHFYSNIDSDLRTLCYRFKFTINKSSTSLNAAKRAPLDELIRLGNDQSLACLFAMFRESALNEDYLEYTHLEYALHHEVLWWLSEFPYYHHVFEIFDYLNRHIFKRNRSLFYQLMQPSPFNMTHEELDTATWINGKNLMLAEDFGLIASEEDAKEFRYWKYKGDNFLIIKELVESLHKEVELQPESSKGLKWLVSKLNKRRPAEKQIKL